MHKKRLGDLFGNIVGGAKGQGMLLINRSPEAELVAEVFFELCGVRTGRLKRTISKKTTTVITA